MKSILFTLLLVLSLGLTYQATADDKPLTGQAKIDSLIAELSNAEGDTNEVNLLRGLSFEYRGFDSDLGLKYGKKGLALAKEIDWKKGMAKCYNSLAVNNAVKANYVNALDYWGKSLKINETLGNKNGVAKNLGNMSIVYYEQSNYPKALEFLVKSLKINRELDNKNGVANNLGTMGIIYYEQSNHSKALEYFLKSLKISEEIGDRHGAAIVLVNIANNLIIQKH